MLGLTSERQGLERAILETQREADLHRMHRDRATNQRDRLLTWYLIYDNLEDLVVGTGPLLDAEEARERLKARHIPIGPFAEEWTQFARNFRREVTRVEEDINRYGWGSGFFHSWVEAHDVDLAERDYGIAQVIYERAWEATHPPEPPPPPDPYGLSQGSLRTWSYETEETRRIRREDKQRVADDRLEELDRLEADAAEQDRRLSFVQERLDLLHLRLRAAKRPPRDLWLGFLALLVLAIGGIVVPLWYMPQPESAYDSRDKWLVIGLFIVGLALVAVYVGRLLPRATWGPLDRVTQRRPKIGPVIWWRRLRSRTK